MLPRGVNPDYIEIQPNVLFVFDAENKGIPRTDYIRSVTADISKSGSMATLTGTFSSSYIGSLTIRLQRRASSSDSWEDVDSWSEKYSTDGIHAFDLAPKTPELTPEQVGPYIHAMNNAIQVSIKHGKRIFLAGMENERHFLFWEQLILRRYPYPELRFITYHNASKLYAKTRRTQILMGRMDGLEISPNEWHITNPAFLEWMLRYAATVVTATKGNPYLRKKCAENGAGLLRLDALYGMNGCELPLEETFTKARRSCGNH